MFTVESEIAWTDLEQQIRKTPNLQPRDGQLVYPYAEATISLVELAYSEVRPTSLYVVASNLETQRQLTSDLEQAGYDPLSLAGGLLIAGETDTVGLIPPIVEETPEDGMYILDGMHRTYLGRQAGRTVFTAIHIANVRADCPAAVLPNEWSEIIEYDKVPKDPSKKRRYRGSDPLSLRRDFSAINGSKPRTI
jgi:hypothetical protein